LQILERLSNAAGKGFVSGTNFCKNESIETIAVEVLMSRYPKHTKANNLVWFPSATKQEAQSFFTSRHFRDSVERNIIAAVTKAEQASSSSQNITTAEHQFGQNVFPGLDVNMALQLCEELKSKNTTIPGNFKIDGESVLYTPNSFLSSRRDQIVQDFVQGRIALLDIDKFVGDFPGQFQDTQDVLNLIKQDQSQVGSGFKLGSHFVISNAWINKKADEVESTVKTSNNSDLKVSTLEVITSY